MKDSEVFDSSCGNVSKYVFTGDDFVAETVLYNYGGYENRTVICCSTQSGCKVGCKFCGTGNKFVRNLTSDEIVSQIITVLSDKNIENIESCKKFQIMFMSMGEPMHNWDNVEKALIKLNKIYPNAQLLISTIGINDWKTVRQIINISKVIDKIGLQFSIHKSNDLDRNNLIPFKDKLSLKQIRDFGNIWWYEVGRQPFLNYCIDGTNNTIKDFENLTNLFSHTTFCFTFSTICSANENMKEAGYKNLDDINNFANMFMIEGYNTRVFNPDGQDDIGGGCGQLWYVQEWLKNNKGDR